MKRCQNLCIAWKDYVLAAFTFEQCASYQSIVTSSQRMSTDCMPMLAAAMAWHVTTSDE